ncbi:MAG: hypothetical protein HYY21_06485 [Candidatus Tectomicrobia bacterium]|nr:hypothetical protein [Candidatus Tectomicrobia bacterium]
MLLQIHSWTATVYLACLLWMAIWIPLLRRLPPETCMSRFAKALVFYHPFVLVLLGVLLMTGAMLITELKIQIGVRFFEVVFHSLGQKLLIFFVIALYSSHMFFGIGLKVTRANAPLELRQFEMPLDDQLRSLRRIHTGTLVNLLLAAYAYYLGYGMI